MVEALVILCVHIIDLAINTIRFLRYVALLPFTPLLKLLITYASKKMGLVEGRDYVVKDWRTYARVFAYGEVSLGEMYAEGWWTTEDLEGFATKSFSWKPLTALYRYSPHRLERYLRWNLFNLQTKDGALASAKMQYNYKMEDFFLPFAGEYTLFSVACYDFGAPTLEDAQLCKLKLIAEKLQLEKGMKVLDIGCGFGALSRYLAANYDVSVTGITNASGMAKGASKRCQNLNATINCCDWRDITGTYDRIVCIEMSEHVGWPEFSRFWAKVRSHLKEDGHMVLQTFLCAPEWCQLEFLCKHNYGQEYIPDMPTLTKELEKHFMIGDVQNLTYNAILTSREMGKRLQENRAGHEKMFGTPNYRFMEYLLVGGVGMFRAGYADCAQFVLFPKERRNKFASFARIETS